MNDGIRRCPHGWPVVLVLNCNGWTEERAPKECRLCEDNKLIETYREPKSYVNTIA